MRSLVRGHKMIITDHPKYVGYYKNLKMIGYWYNDYEQDLPSPKDFIDATWNKKERQAVVEYLNKAKEHESWRWCFNCKFCGKENGSRNLTDGTYVFPEGFAHYIEEHNIKPPQEFIDHVQMKTDLKNLYEMVEKHPLNIESSYTEEHDGLIIFYNKNDKMTMMMMKQDYEDIVKWKQDSDMIENSTKEHKSSESKARLDANKECKPIMEIIGHVSKELPVRDGHIVLGKGEVFDYDKIKHLEIRELIMEEKEILEHQWGKSKYVPGTGRTGFQKPNVEYTCLKCGAIGRGHEDEALTYISKNCIGQKQND